jgi:hypothetical protein
VSRRTASASTACATPRATSGHSRHRSPSSTNRRPHGQLTPYLCVADARAAIEWYAAALGAEVTYEPIVMDDGRVGHCELAIGEARWMMSTRSTRKG